MDYSKTIICGRICQDPETVAAGSTTVTRFSVAVNRPGKAEKPDFYNVKAWGATGLFVESRLGKGAGVIIEGRMEFDKVEKDGQTRTYCNLNADRVVVTKWPEDPKGEIDEDEFEGIL